MPSFRLTCSLLALVWFVLFAVLCIAPSLYAPTYGIEASEGVQFITRRASPMFLGFAILLWVLRDEAPSRLRDMVVIAMVAAFIGISLTGLYDFVRGYASQTIAIAALIETLMAVVLMRANAQR
jgi:hypothetical protein